MKRAALLVLALIASAGIATGPAAEARGAEATTAFGPYDIGAGTAGGGFTWLNRAVGVKGWVRGTNSGGATVKFIFRAGSTEVGTQTRSARDSGTVSYNFTQPGPEGGITEVIIHLCLIEGGCIYEGTKTRP